MPELMVEVDDKGNIGTLPEPLQKFLDKQINDSFKRGAERAEERLKGQLADPAERERLKTLEEEAARLKEEAAKRDKNWEEADRLKEERYRKQLEEKDGTLSAKDQEIARREARLRQSLGAEIRAHAIAAGAREESLPELVKLLGADLDLDPQSLDPFVKGADGKPATDAKGQPVTIEGFVTQYLADHPHHIGRTTRKTGGAPGGATMRGGGQGDEVSETLATVAENPNPRTAAAAIAAIRRKSA